MALTQVYNRLEKVLKRRLSDDYDMMEQSVPTGQDFSVRIGDVSFRTNYARFDMVGFTVYVDGIHVMNYNFPQVLHARFNDEPATQHWYQDSPVLREHVKRAAVEVDKRFRADEMSRQRQQRVDDERAARKLKGFQERFGIPS